MPGNCAAGVFANFAIDIFAAFGTRRRAAFDVSIDLKLVLFGHWIARFLLMFERPLFLAGVDHPQIINAGVLAWMDSRFREIRNNDGRA